MIPATAPITAQKSVKMNQSLEEAQAAATLLKGVATSDDFQKNGREHAEYAKIIQAAAGMADKLATSLESNVSMESNVDGGGDHQLDHGASVVDATGGATVEDHEMEDTSSVEEHASEGCLLDDAAGGVDHPGGEQEKERVDAATTLTSLNSPHTEKASNQVTYIPPKPQPIQYDSLDVDQWPLFHKLSRLLLKEKVTEQFLKVVTSEVDLSPTNGFEAMVIGGGAVESAMYLPLSLSEVAYDIGDPKDDPLKFQPVPLHEMFFAFKDIEEIGELWTNKDAIQFNIELKRRFERKWNGKRKVVLASLLSSLGHQRICQDHHCDAVNPLQQHIVAIHPNTKGPVGEHQYSMSVNPPPQSIVDSVQFLCEWGMLDDECQCLAQALKCGIAKEPSDHGLSTSEMGCLLHNFKTKERVGHGSIMNPGECATMETMVVHRGPDLSVGEVRHVIFLVSAPVDSSEIYDYNTQHTGPSLLSQIITVALPHLGSSELSSRTREAALTTLVKMVVESHDPLHELAKNKQEYYMKDVITHNLVKSLFVDNLKENCRLKVTSKILTKSGRVHQSIRQANIALFEGIYV